MTEQNFVIGFRGRTQSAKPSRTGTVTSRKPTRHSPEHIQGGCMRQTVCHPPRTQRGSKDCCRRENPSESSRISRIAFGSQPHGTRSRPLQKNPYITLLGNRGVKQKQCRRRRSHPTPPKTTQSSQQTYLDRCMPLVTEAELRTLREFPSAGRLKNLGVAPCSRCGLTAALPKCLPSLSRNAMLIG